MADVRILNRKIPPPIPLARMLTRVNITIPPSVDLAPWDGPIKNQKNTGCCTGETKASTFEWIVRKYMPKLGPLVFSPMYAYAVELIAQGNFPEDEGSDGVTLCRTAIESGCCLEEEYPFFDLRILKPTTDQTMRASKHKIVGAYHGVVSSRVALTVLGDVVPWPLQIGFSVYESFMSDFTSKTGIIPVPEPGEKNLGGHEVKASGYDIGVTPTLRPKGCPPAIKFQNSWDTDWGIGGYAWMPLEILDAVDTDIKIMHSGGPWK